MRSRRRHLKELKQLIAWRRYVNKRKKQNKLLVLLNGKFVPWHELDHDASCNSEKCPHCGVDLQGEPIPEEIQHHYGATHGSRKIGIYSMELDRTVSYKCPDCGKGWPRKY